MFATLLYLSKRVKVCLFSGVPAISDVPKRGQTRTQSLFMSLEERERRLDPLRLNRIQSSLPFPHTHN